MKNIVASEGEFVQKRRKVNRHFKFIIKQPTLLSINNRIDKYNFTID